MSHGIANHVTSKLHPGVRVHAGLRLLDADADDGTRYAIGEEEALERYGPHQARRSDDAVLGCPAHGMTERVCSAAQRPARHARGLAGVRRVVARRQLPWRASPNECLRDDEGPLCAPEVAPFASA